MSFEKITIMEAVALLVKNEEAFIFLENSLMLVNSIEVQDNGDIIVTYWDSYTSSGDIESLKFFKKVLTE